MTTAVAVAALLAGPAMTWGLDLTGSTTATVTDTTQSVVQTSEQTVSSTTTTVESTVQATTQAPAVQQTVAAAPVASTPTATAPTPSSPAPAASAPVRSTARAVAAPVKRVPRAAAAKGTVARSPLRTAGAPAANAGAARTAARTVTRDGRSKRLAEPRLRGTHTTASAPALVPACGPVQLLELLPGGSVLNALITTACSAGDLLGPARIGGASGAPEPTAGIAQVLGLVAGSGAVKHARTAARGGHPAPTALAGRPSAAAASTAGSAPVVPLGSGAAHTAGAVGAYPPVRYAAPHATAGAQRAGHDAGTHHGGFFRGQSSGTRALFTVLVLDLLLLAGVLMWGGAKRWVIPRFA